MTLFKKGSLLMRLVILLWLETLGQGVGLSAAFLFFFFLWISTLAPFLSGPPTGGCEPGSVLPWHDRPGPRRPLQTALCLSSFRFPFYSSAELVGSFFTRLLRLNAKAVKKSPGGQFWFSTFCSFSILYCFLLTSCVSLRALSVSFGSLRVNVKNFRVNEKSPSVNLGEARVNVTWQLSSDYDINEIEGSERPIIFMKTWLIEYFENEAMDNFSFLQ